MRKLFALATVLAVAALTAPGDAATKTGTIKAPAPFAGLAYKNPGTATNGCAPTDAKCHKAPLSRAARCGYLADKSTNGNLGYVLVVSSKAKKFSLKNHKGSSADFDIAFYKKLGTCAGAQPRVGGENPDTCFPGPDPKCTVQYIWGHFGTGAETGAIPKGAKYAIVTLWGGANATFDFVTT
jgi:hypothetical protein